METPVTVEPLTDELSCSIVDQCHCVPLLPLSHCRVSPSGMNLPVDYAKHGDAVRDLDIREDDIWVMSFPRSGTTWTQEMVWLLKNNLDFNAAKGINLHDRYMFLEFDAMFDLNPEFPANIDMMKSPRFFKSHLHKQLLPRKLWTIKPKIIFVFRNPKDAALSFYHHYRLWNRYTGSLDLFLRGFVNNKIMGTPFWSIVLDFWNMRHDPNMLFLTYEDMKNDLQPIIQKTSVFLGVEVKKDEIERLLDHLSFASMKSNESVNLNKVLDEFGVNREGNGFIRQGEAGGWKQVFSPEMVTMFDQWTAKHLEGTDFPREYV